MVSMFCPQNFAISCNYRIKVDIPGKLNPSQGSTEGQSKN